MPKGYTTLWTSEMDDLLGTEVDRKIAKRLGLSKAIVKYRRLSLGISSFRARKIAWTTQMESLLGTVPDKSAAKQLGLPWWKVRRHRRSLGIPSWKAQTRVIPEWMSRYDPEADRIYSARRKHRKLGVPDTLTYKQWESACDWFDDCCAYCGKKTFLTEDHLVPLSKGGSRTVLNIVPCCSACNSSKRDRQAHTWIYWNFGTVSGKEIVERIVTYFTEVSKL